jgi:uncharacterized protein (TIGR03083 family)
MTVPDGTMSGMETSQHIAAIQRDGEMLAAAAERAGLEAAAPSCPPWRVRDLVRHQGYVHRWAAGYVRDQLTEPTPEPGEAELLRTGPTDEELLDWFREGHAALVETLRTADPAARCWTVLPGPSCRASWARRQAHETAIHRVDAELAGGDPTPFPADFAADGIDELVTGFFGRDAGKPETLQAGPGPTLQIKAADVDASWHVRLTADSQLAYEVGRGPSAAPADCTLTGPASGLYLLAWNRAEPDAVGVSVAGDANVLAGWRDGMRVTWE